MTSLLRTVIGKTAPHFKAQAWVSAANQFKQIDINNYKGKQWVLLFFYPLDFTFVCPTEIIQFSNKAEEFKKHECQVLGCSIDSHFCHMAYTQTPRDKGGLGKINIPLIADSNKQIADKYGVLADPGVAYRGTFLIDKNQSVRHVSINDLPVGRNVDEYLRILLAFQHNQKHGEVCPASWQPGKPTMVPNYQSQKLQSYWKDVHSTN